MSTAATAAATLVPSGEFAFDMADFRVIADILYEDSGIHLTEAKAPLVYSRLAKRLRVLGLSGFRDYCVLIRDETGADERAALLSALTTNVTRFFREPHHFERLARQVAESLASRARRGERIRLWSAGCSAGHEPYSMAMTVLEAFPEAGRFDVRILATDIDPEVIGKARAAEYDEAEAEPVPPSMRSRFLRRADGGWRIVDEVRALTAFRVLNLHADWPMRGRFDAIFCRNVAIYFDDTVQARLWGRLAERLTPKGLLYIGHSERADAQGLIGDGLTVYRREDAA